MSIDQTPQNTADNNSLVGDETLLENLFTEERDRPTKRWLATMRQRRLIPYRKIGGRLVRYDVAEVRAALDRNFSVKAK